MYIVTLKIAKHPEHDPRNKKTGRCPINGEFCSDVTGEHHTILMEASSSDEAIQACKDRGYHVTRVEAARITLPAKLTA